MFIQFPLMPLLQGAVGLVRNTETCANLRQQQPEEHCDDICFAFKLIAKMLKDL